MANYSFKEAVGMIGSSVEVHLESLYVDCTVLDAKTAFGRVDLLITPFQGLGKQWVSDERVTADKNKRYVKPISE